MKRKKTLPKSETRYLDNIQTIEGELRALWRVAEEANLAIARYDLPELREAILAYEAGEIPPLATREYRKRFRDRMQEAVEARVDNGNKKPRRL
jgi:hypothetical protein